MSGGQGDASTYASTSVQSPARSRTGEEFMKQFSESLVQWNSAGTENQMMMMMDTMRMMMADAAREAAKIGEADEKKMKEIEKRRER